MNVDLGSVAFAQDPALVGNEQGERTGFGRTESHVERFLDLPVFSGLNGNMNPVSPVRFTWLFH